MKLSLRLLSLLILVGITTFYAGCKKDDNDSKTVEQQQLEKLVGQWTLVSATDELAPDRTADFANLVLSISGNYTGEGGTYNYSLTGTRPDPSPWPESGTWKFGTNKATEIIRDPAGPDEISMTYSVTATDLIISFTLPDNSEGWPGGRVENVIGDWTFTFEK